MPETTQEILRKAADVIRTNGWCQIDFYEDDGYRPANECKVCALGAIGVAAGCDLGGVPLGNGGIKAARVFAEHLGLLSPGDNPDTFDLIGRVGSWNDAPDRTESQVVAALLVAAGGEA